MKKFFFIHLTAVISFFFSCQISWAQATRTWVSGVGDDVNPCSRTAPCKTFAGAISKTANAGEINILDPGGYGAVTVTKSMTIDGGGSFGSILASGVTGVNINAPDGLVTLRHLFINGTGSTLGINGVRVISAKKVVIEDCVISNFSQKGIEINTTDSCAVVLHNVTIHNVQDAVSVSTSSGSVVINNCRFQNIGNAGINLMKWQAVVSHSNISDCKIGIIAQSGSLITLSNNVISSNDMAFHGTGKINSAGNNTVTGNRTQGVTPSIIKLQ
jgi:hypothetical protein